MTWKYSIGSSVTLFKKVSLSSLFQYAIDCLRAGEMVAANKTLELLKPRLVTDSDEALHHELLERIARSVNPRATAGASLYVDAQHGLSNRIRALSSGAAIAGATGRKFIAIWQPDKHCDCQLSDLFDYSGEVLSRSFLEEARKTMDVTNYVSIEEGSDRFGPVTLTPGKDAYLRAADEFNSIFSETEAELAFTRALKPSAAVRELLEGVDVSDCIGAHVRMEGGPGRDHQTYDSRDNWPEADHALIQQWRERSHYRHFMRRIDQLLQSGSYSKIFLAADMPETYIAFEERYGERLVSLPREHYDRSVTQLRYALADVILLSRTPVLLGSTWSSFSELAARLATVPQQVEYSGRNF